jgi:peptidoglycan hydrolase-like protein with peptidoglycan-binding domain
VTRFGAKTARRLRRLAAVVGLLAVAGGTVVLVNNGGATPKPDDTSASTTSEASTVERRNLIETDTEAGTLSYAGSETVYDRLSGTITWLPSVGQEIRPGGTLFTVNGKPAILMDGRTPAYRELVPRTSDGPDVLQLNSNLAALGFDPDAIVVDDAWQAATAAGVQELQTSLGEPATGRLALGRVVFLPGDRLVSAVDATLGSEGGGSTSGSGGGNPSSSASPSSSPSPSSSASPSGAAAHSSSPDSHAGAAGESASPTAILQTTSTRLVVTVALDANKRSEARRGEHVTVQLPNGETVNGHVTEVSSIAESSTDDATGEGSGNPSSNGASSANVPVTIALDGQHAGAGLDQASVSVDFIQAVARHVLCVPVTALLATGGADYAVEEAAVPHRLIPVSTGLFAAGYVQISGPGLHVGLRVSDSQG